MLCSTKQNQDSLGKMEIPEQEMYTMELEFCVVPERKEGIEEYLGMVRKQRKHPSKHWKFKKSNMEQV